MAEKDTIKLCAVGDIVAFHKNGEAAFDFVAPILRGSDIVFAQNERHYTDRKDVTSLAGFTEIVTPKNAAALKLGNFHVISFASNHCLDLGPDIMLETIDVLKKLGFAVIGAGKNIDEARQPAIIERKGTRIAFLAYSSVLRDGYAAGPNKAGSAPMRAWTHYHPIDYQPGTPPLILTFPYKDDLEALLKDIRKAKEQADLVAVSMHWGIHLVHAAIAMYQKDVAHAAIDAGADIILGHHPHIPKGIEVYKGKPIFYSMGNFAFDQPKWAIEGGRKSSQDYAAFLDHYEWKIDPEWEEYMAVPPEGRKSMIVMCEIANKKIQRATVLPVLINQKAQPRALSREDKDFNEMVEYIKEISESQRLGTRFTVEGNEIVVPLT